METKYVLSLLLVFVLLFGCTSKLATQFKDTLPDTMIKDDTQTSDTSDDLPPLPPEDEDVPVPCGDNSAPSCLPAENGMSSDAPPPPPN